MTSTDDLIHYRRRLEQEREQATHAHRDDVRHVHLELAALYSARLGKAEPEPRLQVVSTDARD